MDAAPQLRDMRVKAMSQSRPPSRPALQASAFPCFPPSRAPPWASTAARPGQSSRWPAAGLPLPGSPAGLPLPGSRPAGAPS